MRKIGSALTTKAVAALYGVKPDTVKHWCLRGLLHGAYKIGEGNRSTWFIPRAVALTFNPPRRGPKGKTEAV